MCVCVCVGVGVCVCVFGEFAGSKRSGHVKICEKKMDREFFSFFLGWKKHFAQEMMMSRWAGCWN